MTDHSEDNDPFFAYESVDNQVLVELDISARLKLTNQTHRPPMLTVLGPTEINEGNKLPGSQKFMYWDSRL